MNGAAHRTVKGSHFYPPLGVAVVPLHSIKPSPVALQLGGNITTLTGAASSYTGRRQRGRETEIQTQKERKRERERDFRPFIL